MVIFGQLGKLKKDKIDEYKALHAHCWPGVLETIRACRLRNYSIFLRGDQVFSYFEYVGENYEEDMARMARDPVTQEWWTHTKPCFETLYEDMEQIFYLE